MFERILVAYDTSDQSESAFRNGLELAARFQAELLVLSIARPPEPPTRVELQAELESARQHYEEAFARLRAAASKRGVVIQTAVEVGHPAEQIVRIAERERSELIVMGRRGKTKLERWMLGSVSERVLRYAHCPVLVVH
jgi:nucleotide-binding universal stress UspA family protein